MLTIAFVGFGYVGKACQKAFEYNSDAIIIDPKINNQKVADLVDYGPDMVFVSVPAPTLTDGSVDTSLISTILAELASIDYKGVVVLKSTIPPTQILDLCRDTYGLRVVYSPEFLRERTWEEDALRPNMIVIGGEAADVHYVKEMYEKHSRIKYTKFHLTTLIKASMVKYSINTFLAMKVVYFNQLYAMYGDIIGEKLNEYEWDGFIDILISDPRMGESHMQVPGIDDLFGYGGTCFPKDVKAFLGVDKNGRMTVLKEAELANTKIRLSDN